MRAKHLLPFLLLPACMEQDYQVIEYDGTDVFYQNPTDSVDILMVIDDSGSMQPYQEKLGANFQLFLTYFLEADVDYHIAAVTTDVTAENAGRLVNSQVISSNTANAEQVFEEIVNVGITGSGIEKGLESAWMALTEPLVSTANRGFLRNDASLSIVFVSDEEDASPQPVNDYINAFRDIKGQRDRDAFNSSALVVTELDSCSMDAQYWSQESMRYPEVARQTAGVVGDICAQDFGAIVTELSLNTSRLQDTFFLSSEPSPSTLVVTVNEDEVPCEDGTWRFDRVEDEFGSDEPAIIFAREHMPPIYSHITVRYYQGGGDPEDFCQGDEE